jgi:hypothetical protein
VAHRRRHLADRRHPLLLRQLLHRRVGAVEGLDLLRDIEHDAVDMEQRAGLVEHAAALLQHPAVRSVLVADAVLHRERPPGCESFVDRGPHEIAVLLEDQLDIGFPVGADELAHGIAGYLGEGVAQIFEVIGRAGAGPIAGARDVLHERLELLLALLQFG